MEKTAKFWDRVAPGYSKKPIADETTYQTKLALTRQYLNPNSVVLELACGTGSTAIAHAPYVKSIDAIDISLKMVEIAQDKAESAHIDNVSFRQASIDDLSVSDQAFDMVMGHSILHLLKNKSEVIADVNRILKPGGTFVSSTICMGDSLKFRIMAGLFSVGSFLGLLPSLNVFSKAELVESFVEAGFEIDYQWQPEGSSVLFVVAKKV